jgi:leucyl-tRNA synthetase
MRWALADAGDGLDDANFETSTANAAILRITKELTWVEEHLAPDAGERRLLGTMGCEQQPLSHLTRVM